VKELEEETVEAVNLPNISLQLTSLPKFDFVVPPAADIPAVTSTFKFASPITVTENTRTCLPKDNFTFSKPLSAVGNKDITMSRKVNCVDTSIPNCPAKLSGVQFISRSDSKVISSEKDDSKITSHENSEDNGMCFGINPATELTAGSAMDILGKKPNCTDKVELKEVSSSSIIFLDKLKSPPGTWECGACMIHNRIDAVQCIACEASRTSTGVQKRRRPWRSPRKTSME
jgi:nuclear pore complex protein Nup153